MSYLGFCPPGVILPYVGSVAPDGWLLCNGQEVDQNTYKSLYDIFGNDYNTQINPTTGTAWAAPTAGKFRLPDYRGSFLRGAGSPFQGDSVALGGWQAQKTAKNGLASASSAVTATGLKNQMNGSVSGNTGNVSHNHTHEIPMGDPDDKNFSHAAGQRPTADGPNNYWTGVYTAGISQNHHHGWSGSWNFGTTATFSTSGTATAQAISGDNETRPHNKGVNYIIKI